jgi:hypothetical protein
LKVPLTCIATAVLVLLPSTGAAAESDHVVRQLTTMHVTVNGVIHDPSAFDIGWVEQSTGRYFLADGTNNAIDVFDARTDRFLGFVAQGAFHHPNTPNPLATCTALGASDPHDCNGPDGVLTDSMHRVWAGDWIDAATKTSSIKVMDATPGSPVIKSISTGGKFRSDELAYDPRDQVILIANPDFNDGFLTWIDVRELKVIGTFKYSPTNVNTWGGLEQPVWDPETGLFYQAVPGVADANGNVITPGEIDVFKPRPEDGVGQRVAVLSTPTCLNGPTGLTLASDQRLIGACDTGAIIVNPRDNDRQRTIPNVGGADEIWFNRGDGNVYLARTAAGQLGVASAERGRFVANLPTAVGSHSVAAYEENNHVFVPLGGGGGIAVFASGED